MFVAFLPLGSKSGLTDRHSVFYIYGARIRRSCRFAREADDLGRALAMKNRARMTGEESQIGTEAGVPVDVTHELARAVSGIPNPAVEPTLEKTEEVEKRS